MTDFRRDELAGPDITPYYRDEWVSIFHGDCRELLPTFQADALVTDPPFNVGKDYGIHKDAMPDDEYEAMLRGLIEAGPNVQAWVVPKKYLRHLLNLMPDAQLVILKRGAQGPQRWGWSDQHELLLVRGRPRVKAPTLWEGIRLKGEGYFFREETYGHPGYTPYPIMARLVDLLTGPGQTVVDPFSGTGTTLVAAKSQNRRAIGIEINEAYCEIAAKRLAQGVLEIA